MRDERNRLLSQLYAEHYDSVFRVCASITGHDASLRPLIEDCVQDAFVKAIEHYDEFKDYRNPMGWICIAAMNRLKSELRKEASRKRTVLPLSPDAYESAAFSRDDVEDLLDRETVAAKLSDIYGMLTEREKRIFEEYFLGEKRVRQVARDTGFSLNTVRSAIARIRRRARALKGLELLILFFFSHS